MVEAGQVTWDVVDVEGEFGLAKDAAILEEIDYSIVQKAGVETGASTYRVEFMTYSSVLGFNTEKTGGKKPAGLGRLLRPGEVPRQAPRPDGRPRRPVRGVPPGRRRRADKVYPIDADKTLAKLSAIKDQLIFTTSSAQKQDLLSTGEAVMGFIGNGRAYAAKNGRPSRRRPVGRAHRLRRLPGRPQGHAPTRLPR